MAVHSLLLQQEVVDFILEDIEERWAGLILPETYKYAEADYDYIKHFFKQLKGQLVT